MLSIRIRIELLIIFYFRNIEAITSKAKYKNVDFFTLLIHVF